MRHEYLTRADFPTYKPVYGLDERTGETHPTRRECEADYDRLADEITALIPGSCTTWDECEDGLAFLFYWDESEGVADDYWNRETDPPEIEAVMRYDTMADAIEAVRLAVSQGASRESEWARGCAQYVERWAD
jgi:hypothetical protein